MPTHQSRRNLIAKMKLIPVHELINNKSLLLIDDSIVRGTQMRETTEFLYESGAKKTHRPACPPLPFGCKYLNFSRSGSELEPIARRVINVLEGCEADEETVRSTPPTAKNTRRWSTASVKSCTLPPCGSTVWTT